MNARKVPTGSDTDSAAVNEAHVQRPAVPKPDKSPTVSTHDTVIPRHMAAIADSVIALVLAVVVAKSVVRDLPVVQLSIVVAVYLGYYLLQEGFFARTIGKSLTGLVVVQLNGRRSTWRQSLIRTCFRLIEVNPVIGAVPAALSILFSKRHQRFGDKFARTVVVRTQHVSGLQGEEARVVVVHSRDRRRKSGTRKATAAPQEEPVAREIPEKPDVLPARNSRELHEEGIAFEEECPWCETMVVLNTDGQCPQCGRPI